MDKVNDLIDIRCHFCRIYNFKLYITVNPTDMKYYLGSVVWECAAAIQSLPKGGANCHPPLRLESGYSYGYSYG